MHETVQPWQRAHRWRKHTGLAAIFTAAFASAALVILLLPPSVSATPETATYSLNVPATADIFASGMTSLPYMNGGAGTLPVSIGVNPGLHVRFPSVAGSVNPFSRGETGEPYNEADGRTWGGTRIDPYGGISGILDEFQLMFLVGVFTDGSVPAAPAPPPLDFSEGSVGHAFEALSPELGQVFFIGDGRAGLNNSSGALQTFVPPAGATTLFLGFADAWTFVGSPGWYDDNVGSLSVSVAVVPYDWNGFFQPVDNPPTLNSVRAGSAVPVKFSLGGDKGLSIFAPGYPISQGIGCDSTQPLDAIETTVTAGGSSLTYDPIADQYVYVWKTDKAWAGTCRQLVVELADGSVHLANFKMQK